MNSPRSRRSIAVALIGLAAACLPGCSSSTTPSATSTSTKPTVTASATSNAPVTSSTATAGADCTKAGLADAATKAVQAVAKENTFRIDDVKCADSWAVASGLWSSTTNPEMGAPSTLVFQQQGGQWISQDKQKVCGTNASTTPAPADAKIPATLYEFGCLTG